MFKPVPYLSKLEGNQLQPGQSLIVRGIIVGEKQIWMVINLKGFSFWWIRDQFDKWSQVRLLTKYINIRKPIKKAEKKHHFRVELDEEVRVLDDRLLCMRVEIGQKRRKIHLNACINGEWGREALVKHKWKNGR